MVFRLMFIEIFLACFRKYYMFLMRFFVTPCDYQITNRAIEMIKMDRKKFRFEE